MIPPAWTDVWICVHATGHLQAVGTDDAGRRQYLYHPDWRARRDTPAVARAAYVDPGVLDAYEEGRTIRPTTRRRHADPDTRQAALERATVRLLS